MTKPAIAKARSNSRFVPFGIVDAGFIIIAFFVVDYDLIGDVFFCSCDSFTLGGIEYAEFLIS